MTNTVFCDVGHRVRHQWVTVTDGIQCLKCEVAVLATNPDPPPKRRHVKKEAP